MHILTPEACHLRDVRVAPPPARRASPRSAPRKPSPPEGIRRAPHNDPVASTFPSALGAWAHDARAVGTWKDESNRKEANGQDAMLIGSKQELIREGVTPPVGVDLKAEVNYH